MKQHTGKRIVPLQKSAVTKIHLRKGTERVREFALRLYDPIIPAKQKSLPLTFGGANAVNRYANDERNGPTEIVGERPTIERIDDSAEGTTGEDGKAGDCRIDDGTME